MLREGVPGTGRAGGGAGVSAASVNVDLLQSAPAGEWPERQVIQALPWGVITPSDGRAPWIVNEKTKAEVPAAFRARAGDVPLDFDHESLAGPTSRAPASGWIEGVEVFSPGANAQHDVRPGVFLTVRWTPKAQASLASREYRFFSPTFSHDAQRVVVAIMGGGLTNYPAIQNMLPVAARAADATGGPGPQRSRSRFGPDFDRELAAAHAANQAPRPDFLRDPISGRTGTPTEWGDMIATEEAVNLHGEFLRLASPANLCEPGATVVTRIYERAMADHDLVELRQAVVELRRIAGGGR